MKVVISGGSGFVGSHLTHALLARGDRVTILSRKPRTYSHPHLSAAVWAPSEGKLAPEIFEQADAVIHLAGEQIVGKRWTEARKRSMEASRLESTKLLARTLSQLAHPPSVFLSASAVGYYGARPAEETLTESSAAGQDFLAQLCQKWEALAEQARSPQLRVVTPRFGIILDSQGGALPLMALPYRFFVGGHLGSGEQIVPWIHRQDLVRALLFCLEHQTITGPVNCTAPQPVPQREMSQLLAQVLRRPALFPVPSWALRALFGEGAAPLLTGQRALPDQLLSHGFSFDYPELLPALRSLLS